MYAMRAPFSGNLILPFLGLLGAFGCADAVSPPAPKPHAGVEENQARLTGVVVDRFESDQLRTETALDVARVDRATLDVDGTSAVVTIRGETDPTHVRATIRAPRAKARLNKEKVRLEGGVVMTDDAGRTLTTDALDYDAKNDQLTSDGTVRIEGDNFVMEGRRLTGQPRAGKLSVEGPVTSTVSSSSRDTP